jgi:hypothetical protein
MKKGMKKRYFIVIAVTTVVFLAGCASTSYHGRYNQTTPVEERCLFEIGNGLKAKEINGEKVNFSNDSNISGMIIVPNGQYTITFDVILRNTRVAKYDSYSQTTTYEITTRSAYGLEYTGNFLAGHHYIFEPEILYNGGEQYVRVKVTDKGTNTPRFKNGVYSGFHQSEGYWLGMAPTTIFSGGFDIFHKYTHDGAVRCDLWLDFGADLGLLDVGITGAAMAELYLFNTTSSIAAGGGIRFSPGLGIRSQNQIPFALAPFVRAEFKFPRSEWRLFFDYYFIDYIYDEGAPFDRVLFRKWGIGLRKRFTEGFYAY